MSGYFDENGKWHDPLKEVRDEVDKEYKIYYEKVRYLAEVFKTEQLNYMHTREKLMEKLVNVSSILIKILDDEEMMKYFVVKNIQKSDIEKLLKGIYEFSHKF